MKGRIKIDVNADEAEEVGLTAEHLKNAETIITIQLVDTGTHVGLLFGIQPEAYELPDGLKLKLLQGLGELIDSIVNEPEETRQ